MGEIDFLESDFGLKTCSYCGCQMSRERKGEMHEDCRAYHKADHERNCARDEEMRNDEISVKDAIEITNGRWGHGTFLEFFK